MGNEPTFTSIEPVVKAGSLESLTTREIVLGTGDTARRFEVTIRPIDGKETMGEHLNSMFAWLSRLGMSANGNIIEPRPIPTQRKLPAERQARTHKFSINGHEGYVTAGHYEDGTLGEIFLTMAKEGSTISGIMDAVAMCVSHTLQWGVPLKNLVDKLAGAQYEPSGFTKNPDIPIAKSITDYIFRWLGLRYLTEEERNSLEISSSIRTVPPMPPPPDGSHAALSADTPVCQNCGAITAQEEDSVYKCGNCGWKKDISNQP